MWLTGTQTYRIISWDHGSDSYTLLFADHPVLGTRVWYPSSMTAPPLLLLGATLNSSIYSDAQLQAIIEKLESKSTGAAFDRGNG